MIDLQYSFISIGSSGAPHTPLRPIFGDAINQSIYSSIGIFNTDEQYRLVFTNTNTIQHPKSAIPIQYQLILKIWFNFSWLYDCFLTQFFVKCIEINMHIKITSLVSFKFIWWGWAVTIYSNTASAEGGPRSQVCARLTLRSAPHRH